MRPVTRRNALKTMLATSSAIAFNTVFADDSNGKSGEEHPTKVTGTHHPDLVPFDHLMTRFIEQHNVPGASLAVSHNSRIVYARGFGWADVENRRPVHPETLFRIASLSKPFTAVAVLQLIAAGKFELKTHLFDILPAHEWLPKDHDPRLRKVTIYQLLHHTGGWDRDISIDPIVEPHKVAKVLNKQLPVSPSDVVKFTLTMKLDHDPGQRFAYSNVGYLMLGRVIEHVSGQPYEAYVKDHVQKPLGIHKMQLGRAWKADLAHGEAHYYDSKHREETAVCGSHLNAQVPIVYGGENVEGFEAHGGWIASAIDLVKFASALDNPESSKILSTHSIAMMLERPEGLPGHEPDGKPTSSYYGCGWQVRPVGNSGKATTWHNGMIAGTSSLLVRRADGLNWAVLFNMDEDSKGKLLSNLIDPLVHQAADAVKHWPDHVVAE